MTAANKAIAEIASSRHWALVASESGAVFTAKNLARFDVVLWNNVSGDVLTRAQRAAFRRWIEQGGGYVGVHGSGGDPGPSPNLSLRSNNGAGFDDRIWQSGNASGPC